MTETFVFTQPRDRDIFLRAVAERFASVLTATPEIETGTGRLLVRIDFDHAGTRSPVFQADFAAFVRTMGGVKA